MAPTKGCAFTHADGRACAATPMHSDRFCFWHSPDKTDEAKEASRLGGLRRRWEKTVAGAYDVAGLGLGGDKSSKKKMYMYVGIAVAVIVVVVLGVWWAYFRM